MISLNNKIRSHLEFYILHKETIDTELEETGYNDSNTFGHKVWLFIRNILSRYIQTGHTHPIALYEYDLRELWYLCVQGAKLTAAEHPAQYRLVSQVLHTREMGVLSRKSGDANEEEERNDQEGETERASTSDGNIWRDLPFLFEEIRAAWTLSPSIPPVQRHNLSAFIARLAFVGVRDPELCLVGLWILRDTLETPLLLTSGGAEAPRQDSEQRPCTIADRLLTVLVWFQHCGHKIKSLCILNQDFESGVSEIGELAQKA
ncbi:uncharacterized protein EAF02_002747 [Botrytis sinoallii]|uniref:uncharacterized protein n=1 Tax=Botrytis sinoallii TaxID=1463999 RepID=UPI0019026011|nr:uncharacterized protein EAF02_002747 [Botrytis sinoallii]KAF7888206.1 hypothetical protein EAF02_002747 [Botrytis sinoallii]